MDLKYIEQVKHNSFSIPPDEQIYKGPDAILKILNSMAYTVGLVFVDAGKESMPLPLKKARYIESNLYEIEIRNTYYEGRKKVIEIALADICMKDVYKRQAYTYANEADMLNVVLFGKTARQWKDENPTVKGNMRDVATLNQLLVLVNLESYNAVLINQGKNQKERMELLRQLAVQQLQTLEMVSLNNFPMYRKGKIEVNR